MFNRFATMARTAVIAAVQQARSTRAAEVTEEHLLLALVNLSGTTTSELLDAAGVTSSTVDTAFRSAERKAGLSDDEAALLLSELGIDLDEVVAHVEDAHGENVLADTPQPTGARVPFAPAAKDILRNARDQARSMHHKELRDEHLLLALANDQGVAGQLLTAHGLSYLDIRALMANAG